MGGQAARAAGEVDRGPPRALRLQRARARSAAPRARRVRRPGPAARPVGGVLARPRGVHPLRPDRPHHHQHPAARPLQARGLPGRVPVALHEHRHRHAVPRCGPAPGLLRHGTRDGRDRRRPRPRPDRRTRAQLHPARRDALRPGADLPGRTAAGLRLRRLPGLLGQAQGSSWAGTTSRPSGSRPRPRDDGSASGSRATSRAPASGPTRAVTSASRPTAAWSSRPV